MGVNQIDCECPGYLITCYKATNDCSSFNFNSLIWLHFDIEFPLFHTLLLQFDVESHSIACCSSMKSSPDWFAVMVRCKDPLPLFPVTAKFKTPPPPKKKKKFPCWNYMYRKSSILCLYCPIASRDSGTVVRVDVYGVTLLGARASK